MAHRPAFLLLVLLLPQIISGSSAASVFTIINMCPTTVYTAGTDSSNGTLGLGLGMFPRSTAHFVLTAGTSGRIWGRGGCEFDADGRGRCQTGDCAGELVCKVPGQPPATLAEFTLGDQLDQYGLSVVDGFNLPVAFGCVDKDDGGWLQCIDASCPDANHSPDDGKLRTCPANSGYHVVFCPV